MKHVVVYGPHNLKLEERDDLIPLPDEVVVAVRVAGICGSDIAILKGPFPGRLSLPRVLGHEWSGEITKVGSQVNTLKIGDRIVSEEIFWCGEGTACREGYYDHCSNPPELGFTVDGAFATEVCVPARYCHIIPETISFQVGAMIEPLSVAYNAVFSVDKPYVGKKVVVVGLGPIGLAACLWAKSAGAEVIGIEPRLYRREMARSLGISVVLDVDIEESNHVHLINTDVLIEASGVHSMVAKLIDFMSVKGSIVIVSHSTKPVEIMLEKLVLKGIKLMGSCGQVGQNTYTKVIRSLSQNVIDPSPMISHEFNLDDVSNAIKLALNSEDYGKIILVNH